MPMVDHFVKLVKAVSFSIAQIMAVIFIFDFIPGSRYVVMYSWVIGIVVIFIVHFFLYQCELYFLKKMSPSNYTATGQQYAGNITAMSNSGPTASQIHQTF